MTHRRSVAVVPLVAAILAVVFVARSTAGPDKIVFPAGWKDHVLYTSVDRYDTKQYRELYASTQAAVDAMKAGRPLPDGTVLTLVQYKAQVDAAGAPVRGANGRFVKGDLVGFTVMEKRAGWGTEYPAEWRNGDWEYAAFNRAGVLNDKVGAAAAPRSDVSIMGFAFGPNKVTVDAGKPVTWVNGDESPHQIAITSTKARSPILIKGQSHAMTFASAGTYEYMCGLHPNMKGTVEVR